jgi:hypothetical protein
MRIVITKYGKKEIKEDDYDDFASNNIYSNNRKSNHRTISYNKISQSISNQINKNPYKPRIANSIQNRIGYNNLNPISPNKNMSINAKNNKSSFLSKIGELSVKPQGYMTPNKRKEYAQINNNVKLNQNQLLNNNSNNYDSAFKKIQLFPKKLNIPVVMLDKYTKKEMMEKMNNIEDDKNVDNEILKISNTENDNTSLDKDKMYSLRELLIPKNKKNVDDSFLDKKINVNGGESIINYLKMDKTISPSLIEKINKSNNEQLFKLDKICQKYFNDEKVKSNMDIEIKQKIKDEYEQDSIFCRNNLSDMNQNLKSYNNIYKRLRLKKDNYENYKNIYLSHEK